LIREPKCSGEITTVATARDFHSAPYFVMPGTKSHAGTLFQYFFGNGMHSHAETENSIGPVIVNEARG
jgi:hypothetical protein